MKIHIPPLKINFIGSFSHGYVGEVADEVHLANELENLGHNVHRVPRDQWKAYVEGQEANDDWMLPEEADINIICKWHHFNSKHVEALKKYAPVFYWTWDYMGWPNPPGWHKEMVASANLHLTNEGGSEAIKKMVGRPYYFPFDVSSKEFRRTEATKKYDVVFFGSCIAQGDRVEWLKAINNTYKVKVFGWNYGDWQKEGFDAEPAVYGKEFAKKVAESKIVLGFNVNDHCWGYWSNRVGKVLTVGGFLLYRWVPGMELFLRDGADYFSSVDEALEKIYYYLGHEKEREAIAQKGYQIGRDRFTSLSRVKELTILINRFLKGGL